MRQKRSAYRRTISLLTGTSLVLCIGFAALHIFSYFRQCTFYLPLGRTAVFYSQIWEGRSDFYFIPLWPTPPRPSLMRMDSDPIEYRGPSLMTDSARAWQVNSRGPGGPLVYCAETWVHDYYGPLVKPAHSWQLMTRLWLLALAFAVCPLIWLIAWAINCVRTNSMFKQGFCIKCGYDLRATPDRCPECGSAAQIETAA